MYLESSDQAGLVLSRVYGEDPNARDSGFPLGDPPE